MRGVRSSLTDRRYLRRFCKSEAPEPGIRERVTRTVSGPSGRIHFAMRPDRDGAAVRFTAALPQITDQFFTGIQLCAAGLISIKIPDQTNSEGDIVKKIAVHM